MDVPQEVNAMFQESIAEAIGHLANAPLRLQALLDGMDAEKMRVRPKPGVFSPLEDAWHLRDIEREGYLVRIGRILAEDMPVLEDLDGDQMAMARRYNELDPARAVAEFASARTESLVLLNGLAAEAWARRAYYANRTLDLRALIQSMVEHDHAHLSSIEGIYVTSVAA
jgi:hypothetical protein